MIRDWTEEVEIYKEKIKDMGEDEVYQFLWDEYYKYHRLSKRAHDWLVMWI